MDKTKTKSKAQMRQVVLAAAIFGLLFFCARSAEAESDCDLLTGDEKDKCELLEEKAKAYQKLIDLKNKEQNTLAVQLDTINQQQANNQKELGVAVKKLDDLNSEIAQLERDIQEKERDYENQKKILAGVLQAYYDYDQQGTLEVLLGGKDLSDIFSQSAYIEQSGVKINEMLDQLKKTKSELIDSQAKLQADKDSIEGAKNDLQDKKDDLQATESQKQSLLTRSQGDEARYQQLLARVESQKLELFDFDSAGNIGEVDASVGSYPKPSSNLASTGWYFSQRDSRWGGKTIGNSRTLMSGYGCAVTAVSMVFKYHGASIDPGKMSKQNIFYYDLIKWPSSWSGGIRLVSSIYHGNISWSTVDSQIKKGNPVIVYIKRSRGGGHYVVVTGKDSKDYIVHDPYFGPNLYLSTSKSLVGKLGSDSRTSIDQMIVYN